MTIYDISLTISPDLPTWPGDPTLELEKFESMDKGAHNNVSRISSSVHLGTHVDAPYHFLEDGPKLGVSEVFAELDKVHQGKATLQSMVFEPGERILHLAYGSGPATKLTPVKLELGKLFDEK